MGGVCAGVVESVVVNIPSTLMMSVDHVRDGLLKLVPGSAELRVLAAVDLLKFRKGQRLTDTLTKRW